MNKPILKITKKKDQVLLMTHVVIGYPNLEATIKLVKMMAEAGVDLIELQIPFSDPVADGPTIMKANDQSLKNGTTFEDCLQVMTQLSHEVSVPLLFMGYYNSVFSRGVEHFCQLAKKAGAQGLIIPDIPYDEENYDHFMETAEKHGLAHIRLLSPNMSKERVEATLKRAQGFVYCTSRLGTTSAQNNELHPELKEFLTQIREYTELPIAVGFGISQPEHIEALKGAADIAVVGSAMIEKIDQNGIESLPEYIKMLKSA